MIQILRMTSENFDNKTSKWCKRPQIKPDQGMIAAAFRQATGANCHTLGQYAQVYRLECDLGRAEQAAFWESKIRSLIRAH